VEAIPRSSPAPNRRQEYAAATRAAIIQAGRELFAQQGFIATKVEQVGGKHAILGVLMEQLAAWQPRSLTFEQIGRAQTRHDMLSALAHGTRTTREEWADVMRVITETAPHDEKAAAVQAQRIDRYKAALSIVADRLTALEGPSLDHQRAITVLWFYFGPGAYLPLHDDLGWSYPETETWLLEQCERALIIT
jgi:AcrR family transcriptional regulator